MKIILDTNFFLIPGSFKVDIFKEIERIVENDFELVTLKPVVRELEFISRRKDKNSRAAKIGLELLKRKSIKVLGTKESDTDKAIIKKAESLGDDVAVGTLDKKLKEKLTKKGVKVIYLRGKKYLVISG